MYEWTITLSLVQGVYGTGLEYNINEGEKRANKLYQGTLWSTVNPVRFYYLGFTKQIENKYLNIWCHEWN